MVRRQSRVSTSASPQAVDDFSLIKGIGPAIAARLHEAGIHNYDHLASLSPTELAAQLGQISPKRISRQNWIGQARKLAPKSGQVKDPRKDPALPTIRQHYENFTLEFLLDDNNVCRRTRVLHVQSGDADTWAGWEEEQSIDFIARHAGVRKREARPILSATDAPSQSAPQNANDAPTSKLISTSRSILSLSNNHTESPFRVAPESKARVRAVETAGLGGRIDLPELKILPIDSDISTSVLSVGHQYRLRLTVNLHDIYAPTDRHLTCKATFVFKRIGDTRQVVAEITRTFIPSDFVNMETIGAGLPAGIYRLECFVSLALDGVAGGLTAIRKGDLVQVY